MFRVHQPCPWENSRKKQLIQKAIPNPSEIPGAHFVSHDSKTSSSLCSHGSCTRKFPGLTPVLSGERMASGWASQWGPVGSWWLPSPPTFFFPCGRTHIQMEDNSKVLAFFLIFLRFQCVEICYKKLLIEDDLRFLNSPDRSK